MSNNVILDSSALLVLLKNESGAHMIEPLLGRIIRGSLRESVGIRVQFFSPFVEPCKDYMLPAEG